jgi:lysylphosphatidylglycerol synthetase-like protein (DUF2156 family)
MRTVISVVWGGNQHEPHGVPVLLTVSLLAVLALTFHPGENDMKKIVALIVLLAVSFIFLNATEVAVAQWGPGSPLYFLEQQAQQEQQKKAIIAGIGVAVGVGLIVLGILRYIWQKSEEQKKRDDEMKKLLEQKLRENRSSGKSDVPDK